MATWPFSQPDVAPLPGIIHAWSIAPAAIEPRAFVRLEQLLDPAERARAARFHRAGDYRRFTAAHAGLRVLLAAALGGDAAAIDIAQRELVKPQLADGAIEFNISHSGEVVLVALTAGSPVGIDVEEIRELPDRAELAARFFHPAEIADLAQLGAADAPAGFFATWTRKEAVAKALGLGLGLDLDRYRVTCDPHGPAVLLELADPHPAPAAWSMFDLAPAPGHIGALAIPRRPAQLICRALDLRAWV